jgi:hypothetical protein
MENRGLPLLLPDRLAFDAKYVSLSLRQKSGYVSFRHVKGLGSPCLDDEAFNECKELEKLSISSNANPYHLSTARIDEGQDIHLTSRTQFIPFHEPLIDIIIVH